MAKRDKCIREAQLVLKNLVCECGHIETVHVFKRLRTREVDFCEPKCPCRQFRPVEFVITRKARS